MRYTAKKVRKPAPLTPEQKKAKAVCQSKRRHADEITARAAAMAAIQMYANSPALYVYRCEVCLGWHLTRTPRNNGVPATASNPVYEPAPEEQVLEVIREGEVVSSIGGESAEQRWIHTICLQLEQDGKIVRESESSNEIIWRAA